MADETCCVICQESVKDMQKTTLDCTHSFHTDCIIRWFRRGITFCPLCKDDPMNISQNNSEAEESEVELTMSDIEDLIKPQIKISRRKNCDPLLKNKVTNFKKAKENFKEKKRKLYWHERKGVGKYTELRRESKRLGKLVTTAQQKYMMKGLDVLNFEIGE